MPGSNPENSRSRWAASLRSELDRKGLARSLSSGVILYLLEVVMVISFTALVFNGRLGSLLPAVLALMLVGNTVVVLVVSALSSYGGATAVSQDTPAVLLALSAATLAGALPESAEEAEVLSTVLVLVFGSTFVMGVVFLLFGAFDLGGMVRYLPYPVMGGFLAGTGWLLVLGGIGVMQDLTLGIGILEPDQLWHWLPGVVAGGLILAAIRRWRSPSVLVISFAAILGLFYAAAWAWGLGQEALQAEGWLLGPFPETRGWFFPWNGDLLSQVNSQALFSALPSALPAVLIGLVALLLNASSLELVIRNDLDLKRELVAVGLANTLAGMLGGLMGYHSISLSTLNHSLSGGRRLPGLLVAALLLLTVGFGTAALSYVPRILLGSLLVYIGFALLYEWLFQAWARFPKIDVLVILTIFITIVFRDFLWGIGVGLALTVVLFVVSYSRVNVIRRVHTARTLRSRLERDAGQVRLLEQHGDQIMVLRLEGFIFFGTANELYEQVRTRIDAAHPALVRSIVLDFERVSGLDTTGLMSFRKLLQFTQLRGAVLALSGLDARTCTRFAHEGLTPSERGLFFFPDLDSALEWCETDLLDAILLEAHKPPDLYSRLMEAVPDREKLDRMFSFMEKREIQAGDYLMREGDSPDEIMFVESGQVTVRLENEGQAPIRLETTRGGSILGELGFYLQTPRTAHVVADTTTILHVLDRTGLARMQQEDPESQYTLARIAIHQASRRIVAMTRSLDAEDGE